MKNQNFYRPPEDIIPAEDMEDLQHILEANKDREIRFRIRADEGVLVNQYHRPGATVATYLRIVGEPGEEWLVSGIVKDTVEALTPQFPKLPTLPTPLVHLWHTGIIDSKGKNLILPGVSPSSLTRFGSVDMSSIFLDDPQAYRAAA